MRIRTFAGCLAGIALAAGALTPPAAAVARPEPRAALPPLQALNTPSVRRIGIVPRRHAVIANKVGLATIFTSDDSDNTVYGFPSTGGSATFVSSTGLAEPQGLAATKEQLYVANTGDENILVFRPPATTPVLTISDPGESPAGVAVTPGGSRIWVSNVCSGTSCGPGNLQEYSAMGKLQQTITCSNMSRYYFVAVDKAGNVAVDGESASSSAIVGYIKAGQASCTQLPIALGFAGGLAFTKSNDLAVLDQSDATITTYKGPTYTRALATTPLNDAGDVVAFAFQGNSDPYVWASEAAGLYKFAYPGGGNALFSIATAFPPNGVALMPPARVGK